MNIINFIYGIYYKGFYIWSDNGDISYKQYKKIDNLDEIIFTIKKYKPDIISILEYSNITKMPDHKTFILRSINKISPLSFAQERMRFIEKYNNGTNAYNIPTLNFRLKIDYDYQKNILISAIKSIIERHEILRSNIRENKDDESYQVVQNLSEENFPIRQLSLEDPRLIKETLRHNINDIFNLESEFPIRILIIVNSITLETYLSIAVHHIAFDGWSIDLFIKELKYFYRKYYNKHINKLYEPDTLNDLNFHYKDHAIWQRNFIKSNLFANQIKFWKKELEECKDLTLPLDFNRKKEIEYFGQNKHFKLPLDISNNLRALAKELDVTLFTVMISIFYLMLYRFSNQNDIVIGTPVSNRNSKNKDIIGLFSNIIPIRVIIEPKENFREFIKKIAKKIVTIQFNQDAPFEKIVDELNLEKNTSKNPIFQVVFAIENFATSNKNFVSSDKADLFNVIQGFYNEDLHKVSRFDLSFFIDDNCEEMRGNVEFSTKLFKEGTINNFIESFKVISKEYSSFYKNNFLDNPIGSINALSYSYTNKVITKWNDTYIDYGQSLNLLDIFEHQSAINSDRVVAKFRDRHLTYNELDILSNKFAIYLKNNSVCQGTRIAIVLEKNIELLIVILAVQKLGGTFVPIDKDFPLDRINYIVRDSKSEFIVTHSHIAKDIGHLNNVKIFLIEDFDIVSNGEYRNTRLIKTNIHPNLLSYIIYTSGSTGIPKGVLIENQSFMNTLLSLNNEFALNVDDSVLALSSVSFDLSIYDLLAPLLFGGKVILLENSKDPNYLSRVIKKENITIWNSVPQLASILAYHEELFKDKSKFNKIKLFFLSGDKIPLMLPSKLKELFPNSQIICMGGATEASIWSIWYKSKTNERYIPYGCPMPNQKIYVLDKYLNVQPLGVAGQIYIGGIGVARGYSNTELTLKNFIASPFNTSERIYATGDIGKYNAKGEVIFIGRDDNQIKIRGYRVDLSEIEKTILSKKFVDQAIVLPTNETEKKLIAFLVIIKNDNVAFFRSEIIEHCRKTLANYMIPSDLIFIDKIPLTDNAKVDKIKLLSKYKPHESIPAQDKINTPKEKLIAKIWSELLKREVLDRDDDFFTLGGDSIKSLQLVSRLKKDGLKINIKDIFNFPKLKDVAEKATTIFENKKTVLDQGNLELLPMQKWFFRSFKNYNHFNQAFWFSNSQEINLDLLEGAINSIRKKHSVFRFRFTYDDGYWRQYFLDEVNNIKIIKKKKPKNDDELIYEVNKFHKQINVNSNLDIVVWFEGYGFIWIIHHLLVDIVSWKILLDDLNSAYSCNLPANTTNSLTDWREYLTNYSELDEVISFYSHKDLVRLKYEITEASCAYEIVQKLDNNFTLDNNIYKPFEFYLTALKLSLADVFNDFSISIDIESHGREVGDSNLDLSETIGWFTTIHPLNIKLSEPNNYLKAIQEVKGYLDQIPDKGLGYWIAFDKGKINHKSASVVFNYLGEIDKSSNQTNIFSFADYPIGENFSKENTNKYLLDITLVKENSNLYLKWKYLNSIEKNKIENLCTFFEKRLKQLAFNLKDFKLKENAKRYSAEINSDDLDVILGNYRN